ncbi:protein FAM228A isoform 4-T5 [Spinachia spinachia]
MNTEQCNDKRRRIQRERRRASLRAGGPASWQQRSLGPPDTWRVAAPSKQKTGLSVGFSLAVFSPRTSEPNVPKPAQDSGMSPANNSTARRVATFHTPLPVSRWNSQCGVDVKEAACPSPAERKRSPAERARKRDAAPACGPQPGAASLGRLEAQMDTLLDTERGLVKDLERFLSQRRVTELRRTELMHKRWTEREWLPLQRRVEERASTRGPAALKRRRSSYSHYLHHCNTKGFVFLDIFDLREYNPFRGDIKTPPLIKLSTGDLEEPHDRLEERGTPGSCEAGCKYTRKQVERRPQGDPPLCESVFLSDVWKR